MKKIVFTIFAAGVLLIIGVWSLNAYMYQEKQSDTPGQDSSLASYFKEQMIARGIEDIGHPIEGFDANILMRAFPGLEPSDFAEVEAFEGTYSVTGDDITFERTQPQPMSSAERTISDEGYATLLDNVAARLMHPIMDTADADMLIDTVDTGERVEAALGESAEAFGVTITPRELLEDSRCPGDTNCIQEGTVRVQATLTSGLGTADQEFQLGQTITTETEQVTLIQAAPLPETGRTISNEEYVFYFEILKR